MNRPKKILYIITKSNFFGAQKYVYELATAAKVEGHEVLVACGGTGKKGAELGVLAEKLQGHFIKVRHVKNFMRDMSILNDFLAIIEVTKLLLKERPDIIHVTSSKAGGIGAFAGRLVGTRRIIFTSHGLTMDETWRPSWQRALITWGTWLTMMLSHHSIMISTETYERTRKMPLMKNRVSLIFNGISPIDFLDKATARHELQSNASENVTWIGGIGELHPNKNWQSLILALKDLPETTHLFIIGEGQDREDLEKLIKEKKLDKRVHLLGYKAGCAPYLKAFDIFVLPSKKEGLPYVLLEAGLAGLPTIASNLPGNYDIINHGHSGLLVEPSPENLKAALTEILASDDKKEQFGQALQKHVTEKFSITKMQTQTFASYLL